MEPNTNINMQIVSCSPNASNLDKFNLKTNFGVLQKIPVQKGSLKSPILVFIFEFSTKDGIKAPNFIKSRVI